MEEITQRTPIKSTKEQCMEEITQRTPINSTKERTLTNCVTVNMIKMQCISHRTIENKPFTHQETSKGIKESSSTIDPC